MPAALLFGGIAPFVFVDALIPNGCCSLDCAEFVGAIEVASILGCCNKFADWALSMALNSSAARSAARVRRLNFRILNGIK